MSLRAGLVGTGAISRFHVQALRKLAGVEIVGVTDLVRSRADEFAVATGVLEIDRGRGRYEKGSYSTWRRVKAERVAAQAGAFERQQEELAHLQRFVDRFRYGTKARQAQSKLKAMARIERVERPTEQRSLRFDFPPPARSITANALITMNRFKSDIRLSLFTSI